MENIIMVWNILCVTSYAVFNEAYIRELYVKNNFPVLDAVLLAFFSFEEILAIINHDTFYMIISAIWVSLTLRVLWHWWRRRRQKKPSKVTGLVQRVNNRLVVVPVKEN